MLCTDISGRKLQCPTSISIPLKFHIRHSATSQSLSVKDDIDVSTTYITRLLSVNSTTSLTLTMPQSSVSDSNTGSDPNESWTSAISSLFRCTYYPTSASASISTDKKSDTPKSALDSRFTSGTSQASPDAFSSPNSIGHFSPTNVSTSEREPHPSELQSQGTSPSMSNPAYRPCDQESPDELTSHDDNPTFSADGSPHSSSCCRSSPLNLEQLPIEKEGKSDDWVFGMPFPYC